MFSGAHRDNGTEEGMLTDFTGFFPVHKRVHALVIYGIAPILEQVLHLHLLGS